MTNPIMLDLNKAFELNLDKVGISKQDIPTMEVRLAIDKSGSMEDEFRTGLVDTIVNRFLGVAMSFDDNASVEVGFFNHCWHDAPEATPADVGTYVKKSGQRADGGTAFSGIIQAFETGRIGAVTQAATAVKGFLGGLFGKKTVAAPVVSSGAGCAVPGMRAYTAIVTDGDNSDKREFEAELAKTGGDVFYQFITIGNNAPTSYLRGLAAKYKHVSIIEFRDPFKVTADDFYAAICNDTFIQWMK